MRNIVPRLRNLLAFLIGDDTPVAVTEMAKHLRVSRRTVFRELENIDSLLAPYGLSIGSKPGEGILLVGPEPGREKLKRDLHTLADEEPLDRRDRHQRLILSLIQSPGRKLFAHADRFRVSIATISHDLDEIESWLAGYRLTLARKAGSGISIVGEEKDIRRAIIGIMQQRRKEGQALLGYPSLDIVMDIEGLRDEIKPFFSLLTPASREALELYLMVMVQRILDKNRLAYATAADEEFMRQASAVCAIVEDCFNVAPGPAERDVLALEFAAARRNPEARDSAQTRDARLLGIAYQIIERYDANIAHLLKLDDLLIDGLIAHLRSAVIRVENRIDAPDPLLEQIRQSYPDVMAKCRRASEVLLELGAWLPESEASFLAAHFGAAVLRLAERGLHTKNIRIGIVCLHGIGTSYLLASQVRKLFGNEAEIAIGWVGDSDSWKQFDFLISTTPLDDVDLPVVVAPPVLDEDGIARIREKIKQCVRSQPLHSEQTMPEVFADACGSLEEIAADCRTIVSNFVVEETPADSKFQDLVKLAGYRFGDSEKEGKRIYQGLRDREKITSQVIPELKLVLLHCRSSGVNRPLVAVFTPEAASFSDPYLAGARAALVMLVPETPTRLRTELMGEISASLLEGEGFLTAVLEGDGEMMQRRLQDILCGFLLRFANQNMKG